MGDDFKGGLGGLKDTEIYMHGMMESLFLVNRIESRRPSFIGDILK